MKIITYPDGYMTIDGEGDILLTRQDHFLALEGDYAYDESKIRFQNFYVIYALRTSEDDIIKSIRNYMTGGFYIDDSHEPKWAAR